MATKKKSVLKKSGKKASAKKPAKKAAKKKSAAPNKVSKSPAKKAVKKVAKAPAKKIVKAPAKKVAKKIVKKVAPKKAAPKKAVKVAAKKPASKPHVSPGKPARAFRKEDLAFFRGHLQRQLDLVQGNLNSLASDNLKRSPIEATGDISAHSTHMADQGTDNFDRELALNLASSRQDSLYDIEDAIRRVDDGSYGACESCGRAIERPRLKALPFAKKCMGCQNAAERGRTKYRPFGGTLPLQQLAAEDASGDSPDSMG
jgi:RNA polymerase-binding transcription factor DksA